MIVVIDYGAGNLRSIINKLERLGVEAVISSKSEIILKADKLILPGVGFFSTGMENLKKYKLIEVLNKKVIKDKTPILGVCLGAQLFCTHSEEGEAHGLGWIDAEVKKFNFPRVQLKVPHMGWNSLEIQRKNRLLENIPKSAQFYFVHSYHICCNNKKDILAQTNYGYDFASAVNHKNLYGTQFHPEKSHQYGMKIISNFIYNIKG